MIQGLTSIVLPTTSRPERAEACVRQLLAVTTLPLEVICVIDDDIETTGRMMQQWYQDGRVRVLFNSTVQGPARAWNQGLVQSNGEYLVLAADDLVFHAGWLEAALKALATLPEGIGLVGLHDGHQEAKPDGWCTHWLAHRRFIIDYMGGVMAFECYRYGYNDTEAWFRATRAGRYLYCVDALVEHKHYDYGTREQDDLDRRNRSYLPEATEVMHKRMAAGWPDDFPPVIKE